ncbi:MAG: hypothetical protein GYA26_09470 [Flexilinea flocculi]|nr:hypothetical protein [Flexilinea flocculi]
MQKIAHLRKTLQSLKPFQIRNYFIYIVRLRLGAYKKTAPKFTSNEIGRFRPLNVPVSDQVLPFLLADSNRIEETAQKILNGRFFPFMKNVSEVLSLKPENPSLHWTKIHPGQNEDIKLIWEPARFSWMYSLVRAWMISKNPVYQDYFWTQIQHFNDQNPAYFGENWFSAQESAMRIITLSFCASVFLKSSPSDNKNLAILSKMIYEHACRIPSTLSYARSQNNNHWLSDAAGLMTAACVLPAARQSEYWFRLGWREFQNALNHQILPDGAYIQYSPNYHRLMLELVLWVNQLLSLKRIEWPENLHQKIGRSITWLIKHTDRISGSVCNIGHNDGSNLFPLGGEYQDFRPVLQALSKLFLAQTVFPVGPWDELYNWFIDRPLPTSSIFPCTESRSYLDDTILRIGDDHNWALLQVSGFQSRPAHDDQLNIHIFHNGRYLALDAGTYRYNSAPPWNNGLKTAFVHNSLLINQIEPMDDAGKFLWLDWDQARILKKTASSAEAEHFAYQKIGLKHTRTLERDEGWMITDRIIPISSSRTAGDFHFRLHWLLPDLDFQIQKIESGWKLATPEFNLAVTNAAIPLTIRLIRAGKPVYSTEDSFEQEALQAISGWFSRTYDERIPALSLIITGKAPAPFTLQTEWRFP